MSLRYANITLTPGMQTNYAFKVFDDTGVPIDLTGYTFRWEFFDKEGRLTVLKTSAVSTGLGLVTMQLAANDGAALTESLYKYRLILISPLGGGTLAYSGYLKIGDPAYDPDSSPTTNVVVFPDGTIYPLGPITLAPNTWYAIASFFRILVTGEATIGMDGRDISGDITGNLAILQTSGPDPVVWNPAMGSNTAFRVNVISGGATLQYLP